MPPAMMYCSDALNARRVDEHFAAEAAAAREAGASTVLLDHDALLAGDVEAAVVRVPRSAGPLWYRGWMVPSSSYQLAAAALAAREAPLVVEAAAYRAAHELPGWYGAFAHLTPRSVWTRWPAGREPERAELADLVAPLGTGAAIVKDFVKSRKHEWDEACFVPDLTDLDHLQRVVARFVELQEDSLAGGLVVRAFEVFEGEGEARVWWLDGEPVLVGAHPDTPHVTPSPALGEARDAVVALGCRFVTTDLALRSDGRWRVVEVGDGQVSDLPSGVDPGRLVTALVDAPTTQTRP